MTGIHVVVGLLVFALSTAVLAAACYGRRAKRFAAQAAAAAQAVHWRDGELAHLVHQRLPDLLEELRNGEPAPTTSSLQHDALVGTAFAELLREVLGSAVQAHKGTEQAAQGLIIDVARRLGGLANSQQVRITEMQKLHDDQAFLKDLMDVDHTNAQILRRVVSLAVTFRSWPGRQHNDTTLHNVLRGAIGRIGNYKRVQIAQIEDARAVAGRAVEGLVVALAELLENATNFSPPNAPVHIHIEPTHVGLAVVIEDAGIGLNQAERAYADRLLNADALSAADLRSPPRIGLAACGALGRRYGFRIAIDANSVFGGVRAVVTIPAGLLTQTPSAPDRPKTPPAPPARPVPDNKVSAMAPGTTAHGLPMRVRQEPAGRPPTAEVPASAERSVPRSPEQAAAPLGALQRAGQAAAAQRRPPTEGTTPS